MNRDHTFSADSRDGFDSFTPSADDWQEWLDFQADNLSWPEPEWDEDEEDCYDYSDYPDYESEYMQ